MVDWTNLTRFIFLAARMSGFVIMDPILGRKNLPGIFRSGLILVLTVFTYSAVGVSAVTVPPNVPVFMIIIAKELLLGFFLGMVIHFFLYIPQMAGLMVDTQMGMTMNQIYDAGAQGNLSVTGEVMNILMLLLFFAANGHHTLLRILITSEQVVPLGNVFFGDDVINAMLEIFVECTLLALKLSMPILAAELVGQLGMGLLMKVIPQINVFSINIELKVLIGLVILFLMIAPFSEFFLSAEMEMLDDLARVLSHVGTAVSP